MKKIDAHFHVAEVVAGYCRRGESRSLGGGKAVWGNGEVFQLMPPEFGDRQFTVESAMQIMQNHDVTKAVLMQGSMYGFQNQYHYHILKEYPDVFCPSCTVDPFMTDALQTLKTYLKEYRFRLVKFEVSSGGGLMGCHEAFSLMSDRMQSIYEMIAENRGILALDVGDLTMNSHQPENLVQIAERFPDLTLVHCHLLAPNKEHHKIWRESLAMLKQDNVWFDISALPKIMNLDCYPYQEALDIIVQAKEIVGADRLMWGTDAPFAAVQNSYKDLALYLEDSKMFTSRELEDIYYQNAEKVYFK